MDNKWPEGIKKTKQRERVYGILLEADEPMSAVDIFKKVPGYALSTIYRILTAFEENHMVVRLSLPGEDTAVYELNRGEHKHYALCLECREMIPLKTCPFEHVNMETSDNDFQITGHRVEIYGYCKKCRDNQKK